MRDVNEGVRIAEPSGKTEVNEFDIAVDDVSRVDVFQMEKLVKLKR